MNVTGTQESTHAEAGGLEYAGRIGWWTAYPSAAVAVVGIAFLMAMFIAFAIGARGAAMVLGWINDVLVLVSYLLSVPVAITLYAVLRRQHQMLSALALITGIGALASIVVLQWLLITGVLTFEQQIGPVSITMLGLACWFVLTGYLVSSSGLLSRGVWMGLLAATYVGYPIWALWIGRYLRRQAPS